MSPQPTAPSYNALAYFQRWFLDLRLNYQEAGYYNDLNAGTLPQMAVLITASLISEHPPAYIQMGQQKMQPVITALIHARAWGNSALFFTYSEGGGYFEHLAPPQVDAYSKGIRVPPLVISPWASQGYLSRQLYEHRSVLQFIERRFGLPSLASVNHQFDTSTPDANNDVANGQPSGPPAPPRDGLVQIGDFYGVFRF